MHSLLSLPSSSTSLNPSLSFPFKNPKADCFPKSPLSLPPKPFSSSFKLNVSSSPSISPAAENPLDPEPETRSETEKFDWFSQWYPLAPICDLDRRAPHAKRVLGVDVVIWWDREADRWQVFDDRCPHRLAPLSEGRIDKWGRLQCVYHGWCFDGKGSCKYIPQAPPDGPPVHTFKNACVAVYPSVEQNKILWFWPNTNPKYKDILDKKKPPNIPELDDPSYSCTMGSRDLHYGYDVLIENFMDPAHGPYAHHGIMKFPKLPGPPPPDREGGRPLEISIEILNINGFLAKQQLGYGQFVAPCLYYAYPSRGSSNGSVSAANIEENSSAKIQQKQPMMLLIFYCIPVSPGKSRVIWAFPRNFAVWVDKLIPQWIFHLRNNLVLDSDMHLLHVEERKFAEVGASNWQKACFVPTKSDAQVVAFRKWLKKYSNDKVDWGAKFNGELLPPTPPREQLMDRYWTHVVNCSSCRAADKGFKALEACLQVISLASIGILAAAKEKLVSTATRTAIVLVALLFFLASRWLAHFVYRNFHYHDYNHAFV